MTDNELGVSPATLSSEKAAGTRSYGTGLPTERAHWDGAEASLGAPPAASPHGVGAKTLGDGLAFT